MNISKESLKKVFTLIIALCLIALITSAQSIESREKVESKSVFGYPTVICTYKNIVDSKYKDGRIIQEVSAKEPIIATFVGVLNGEVAELRFHNRSVSFQIAKLHDDGEKYVFLDGNSNDHNTVYTIYKKIGISTFAMNDGVNPTAQFGMGTCEGDSYDMPR